MAATSVPGTLIPSPSEIPPPPPSRIPGLLGLAKRLRRNPAVRSGFLRAFRFLQQRGVCVTPNHFYWPIPDLKCLSSREWPVQPQVHGIDFRYDRQLELLRNVIAPFAPEWTFAAGESSDPAAYHYHNGLFETVDAEIAYALVRWLRPRRIIEIGGGYSTRLMAAAVVRNAEGGADCELISIDPHPNAVLLRGFPGLARVIAAPVQQAGLDLPTLLGPGDILFIDSSHVVAVGSDVVYEFLDVLPRLRSGVTVHVHDIFLPADYPRSSVLEGLCFWSEQYLLQAFLAFNPDFEVMWASSAMALQHPEALLRMFPAWNDSYSAMPVDRRQFVPALDGERLWPSSFWMRRR